MCGIVGYVGPRKARALLLKGLEKLEYRGYDSAGISVLDGDRIDAVRAVGNLSALRAAIDRLDDSHPVPSPPSASVALAERPQPETGIGHTRWATHGRVTAENAHPHFDTTDSRPHRRQRDRRELHRAEGKTGWSMAPCSPRRPTRR